MRSAARGWPSAHGECRCTARGVDARRNRGAELHTALAQMPHVEREAVFLVRVDYFEAKSLAHQFAPISDLSAAFAVERSAVENNLERPFMADLR